MSSDGDVMDGLSHDDIEQTVGTESAAVIDSLKCQLQQSTLAQQTTNIQLAAIKQVLPYLLTVHCVLGVKFGSPSHMLVRFSLAERTVPVLLRPLGSYRQIVATGKKEDDKINSLSKFHIYFINVLTIYHARKRVPIESNGKNRMNATISRDVYAANWFSQGHAHFD